MNAIKHVSSMASFKFHCEVKHKNRPYTSTIDKICLKLKLSFLTMFSLTY